MAGRFSWWRGPCSLRSRVDDRAISGGNQDLEAPVCGSSPVIPMEMSTSSLGKACNIPMAAKTRGIDVNPLGLGGQQSFRSDQDHHPSKYPATWTGIIRAGSLLWKTDGDGLPVVLLLYYHLQFKAALTDSHRQRRFPFRRVNVSDFPHRLENLVGHFGPR